jgi:tetratricopeptide (TPR) repeat protein/Cdc6-like AAA superfamily ATPase
MSAPIAREREFEALLFAADEAVARKGSIALLAGATGSGKSLLLRALVDALADESGQERLEVVSVRCYETSAGNPLGPFGEILRALTSRERRADRAKRILELVGQVTPPLVELIPVIGKLAALGLKAAADAGVYALGGDREAQQAELAADVAMALQRVAADIPLVVVLDDAQWIDAPSTEVIARLADHAEQVGLLVVVAYDGDLVDDRHSLARLRSRLVGRRSVRRIALNDFGREAIEAILRDRYGDLPDPRLAEWLLDRTEGSPLFLEQYLITLENQHVLLRIDDVWSLDGSIGGRPGDWQLSGSLAKAQTPATLLEFLRPRVADLEDEDRSLLEHGAIQGRRFLSTVLVTLLGRDEDEILAHLGRLEERSHMIVVEQGEDWWSDRSSLYAFDPGVLQELLYGRYARSAYERRKRHRAVASALEALIADDDPPPRHALLEIARHYENAGDLAAAARRLVDVADSTFAEGADRETAAIAERAVALVRTLLARDIADEARLEVHRLLARAIVLLVLAGEGQLAEPFGDGRDRLIELVEEGKQAADFVGDAALRANTRYASAVALIRDRGLHEGIAEYREALVLAREAGDALAEFAVLVRLGHQLNSVSLREGWDVLQEAHALLCGGALADHLDARTIARETASLETMIGVAAFDLGRFGEAHERLVRGVEALRRARRRRDTAWALSFLGQLHTAIGLFEAAEATLREGVALFADDPPPSGLRGYLRALLGRLYLQWTPPRLVEAREDVRAGREEITASGGYRSVSTLVDAYWAEVLLAEGTPQALREADAVLAAVETFGWARTEITIARLRARVALAQGRRDDACRLSVEAIDRLNRCGGMVTAVRTEEVLFTHAHVLAAAGSSEAAHYARDAAKVIREKAASMDDPMVRTSFLERVRLSHDALAAADSGMVSASGP